MTRPHAHPSRPRIVIADDDPFVRQVVRQALQAHGCIVVAEAGTGREGAELTLHYRPDLLLVDLQMPDGGGLEAIRRVRARSDAVSIVVLSVSGDDADALAALQAGADGFLTKGMDLDALVRALRAVLAGEPAISRRLVNQLLASLRDRATVATGLRPIRSPLTSREWEVLDLLCDGATTDDVARKLVLSPETVRSHVKAILRKTGAHTRAEAVRYALELRRSPPGAPLATA